MTIGETYWVYRRDFFGAETLIRHPLAGPSESVDPRRFPRTMARLLGRADAERKVEK
jgi:hypothetical protein